MSLNPNPASSRHADQKSAADGFDSVARLLHLGRIADTQSAAARDLQGRRNDIASEIAAKRREQEQFGKGVFADAKRYDALGKEIATLESQRDALDAAQREAANAAADALRLHESCSLFAHQNGLPRPSIHSSNAALPAGSFQ